MIAYCGQGENSGGKEMNGNHRKKTNCLCTPNMVLWKSCYLPFPERRHQFVTITFEKKINDKIFEKAEGCMLSVAWSS